MVRAPATTVFGDLVVGQRPDPGGFRNQGQGCVAGLLPANTAAAGPPGQQEATCGHEAKNARLGREGDELG